MQIKYVLWSRVRACSLRVFVALFVDGGCVLCVVCGLDRSLMWRYCVQAALNVNCWYVGVVLCVRLRAVLCSRQRLIPLLRVWPCVYRLAPDEHNLDPTTGGMHVYDIEAPEEWTFKDFNGNAAAVYVAVQPHCAMVPVPCLRCSHQLLCSQV